MKTLKQHIRKLTKEQYQTLTDFCHYSNNLYNFSLYVCNEYFQQTGKYIGFKGLWNEVKTNENAKLLPSQMSRQVVKLVDKNYRSFFALLRRKKCGEYADTANPPHYKKRGDVFLLICPLPGFSMCDGYVSIHSSVQYKKTHGTGALHIPFTHIIDGEVKQITIKPFDGWKAFNIYYTYEERAIEKPVVNTRNCMGLDLGINNLVTGVCHPSGTSFIINGKPLKAYNQLYNKTKARLQAELEIKQHVKWSHRLAQMTNKRDWFIDNYMNQTVTQIVKICRDEEIGRVVLGYNATWKKNVNMGKRTNQKFYAIPYLKLIKKLTYKLESFGIVLETHEESYTSKCSFIDREALTHHDQYIGRRSKRGLFITADGHRINADCNGAANILRKVIGNAVYNGNLIEGLMLDPIKIQILIKNMCNVE
jgi:putative transposase